MSTFMPGIEKAVFERLVADRIVAEAQRILARKMCSEVEAVNEAMENYYDQAVREVKYIAGKATSRV